MNLSYVLKAGSIGMARHRVYAGRWLIGDLMITPTNVTFHPVADVKAAVKFPTREAFEASLDEEPAR